MILPGRDVPFGVFARSLWHRTLDHDVVDYAGSVAFSFVLALFPFLVFAVALTGLVIDPRVLDSLLEPLREVAEAAGALGVLLEAREPLVQRSPVALVGEVQQPEVGAFGHRAAL